MNDKDSVMDGVPTARVARRRRVTVIVGRVRMRARPGRPLRCLATAVLAAGLAAGPAVARTRIGDIRHVQVTGPAHCLGGSQVEVGGERRQAPRGKCSSPVSSA
jgi:hypothetical protein